MNKLFWLLPIIMTLVLMDLKFHTMSNNDNAPSENKPIIDPCVNSVVIKDLESQFEDEHIIKKGSVKVYVSRSPFSSSASYIVIERTKSCEGN